MPAKAELEDFANGPGGRIAGPSPTFGGEIGLTREWVMAKAQLADLFEDRFALARGPPPLLGNPDRAQNS
jgi:hypothetical protein